MALDEKSKRGRGKRKTARDFGDKTPADYEREKAKVRKASSKKLEQIEARKTASIKLDLKGRHSEEPWEKERKKSPVKKPKKAVVKKTKPKVKKERKPKPKSIVKKETKPKAKKERKRVKVEPKPKKKKETIPEKKVEEKAKPKAKVEIEKERKPKTDIKREDMKYYPKGKYVEHYGITIDGKRYYLTEKAMKFIETEGIKKGDISGMPFKWPSESSIGLSIEMKEIREKYPKSKYKIHMVESHMVQRFIGKLEDRGLLESTKMEIGKTVGTRIFAVPIKKKVKSEPKAKKKETKLVSHIEKVKKTAKSRDRKTVSQGRGFDKRFEYTEGTSNKFWGYDVRGKEIDVYWGPIGKAKMQMQTQTFSDIKKARRWIDVKAQSKVRKGYQSV